MKAQHGLDVQVEATDNLNISDNQMRLLLFQTLRELLFNIVKHAGTLQAKVTLAQSDGRARITITDSGKGFDVPAVMNDSKLAHGLLVVQDRLSLLGCSMQITSQPGQGTHIVIDTSLAGNSGSS